MLLLAYYKLSTCSRRALLRLKGRRNNRDRYSPQGRLLERLSRELGMNKQEAYRQLLKERQYLLKQRGLIE